MSIVIDMLSQTHKLNTNKMMFCHTVMEVSTLDHKFIRYTIGQLSMLNNGHVNLPASMKALYQKYTIPVSALERPYNNPHNIHFARAQEGRTMKRAPLQKDVSIYDDSRILSCLRHAFNSIANSALPGALPGQGQVVVAIAEINQLLIPATMLTKVAELFYNAIIEWPQQTIEFLNVLFGISCQDAAEQKIQLEFVKHTIACFTEPPQLTDTHLESGESHMKRQREATSVLLARLFTYSFSTSVRHEKPRVFFSQQDRLQTKFLDPLFARIDAGNADYVKCLTLAWPILAESKRFNLSAYLPRIRTIYENKDKKFKLATVLLLGGFL